MKHLLEEYIKLTFENKSFNDFLEKIAQEEKEKENPSNTNPSNTNPSNTDPSNTDPSNTNPSNTDPDEANLLFDPNSEIIFNHQLKKNQ